MTRTDHDPIRDVRARRALVVVAFLAAAFFAGTLVAPLLTAAGHAGGPWLDLFYAPMCHQMPERSLAMGDVTQAVCARCSGLYLGGVIGLVAGALYGLRRGPGALDVHRGWLLVAFLPSLVDFALPFVGFTGLSNVPRFLLALPAGFAAALFLAIGIADLFERRPAPAPVEVIDG